MNNESLVLPDEPDILKTVKVVQLLLGGTPLLCRDNGDSYHCLILENFLESRGIVYKKIGSRSGKVPALKGSDYEVVGMGYLYLDTLSEKFAVFSGDSFEYRIGLNKEHIEVVKKSNPEWIIRIRP